MENRKNKEKRPLVLLHDVRSFLSDIKHYFISNPHIGLAKKIDRIVSKSSSVDVGEFHELSLNHHELFVIERFSEMLGTSGQNYQN